MCEGCAVVSRVRALVSRVREQPLVARAEAWGRRFVADVVEDRLTGLAAEIAFWWVFTLFPALLALASLLGGLDALFDADVETQVEDWLVELLTDYTGEGDGNPIVSAVQGIFDTNRAGTFTVGFLLAIWSTSRAFTAMINSLDVVYEQEESRPYWRVRSLGLALAFGTLLAVTVAAGLVIIGPLFGRGADLAADLGAGSWFATLWDWLRLPVALLLLVLWLTMLYVIAPNHEGRWREQLPGAIVTAAWWLAASGGFRLYLETAGGRSFVFGLLGGMLTLMLWLYLLAIGILVGGEVNELAMRHRANDGEGVTEAEIT